MRPRLTSDEVLLDAALKAFAELGYEGASIRALCRMLNVSHNTLNQRFGSKDKLWYAAVDRGFAILMGELETTVASHDEPFEQLRASMLRYLELTRANPGLVQIINQESARPGPRFEHIFAEYLWPISEFALRPVRELQDSGVVRPGPVPTIFAYLTTFGLGLMGTHPHAFRLASEDSVDLEKADALAVEMVLDSIRMPRA